MQQVHYYIIILINPKTLINLGEKIHAIIKEDHCNPPLLCTKLVHAKFIVSMRDLIEFGLNKKKKSM